MKLKAFILPIFFILLVFPLALFSQDLETIISADQITVQPDNILKANGNVSVKRGNVSIKAKSMTVNEAKNQIEIEGIIEFFDGKALKLAGENGVLSDDLTAGIMNAARVVIDDTIRIRAEKIKLKNGTVEHAENIDRITSCKECENEHLEFHGKFSCQRHTKSKYNLSRCDIESQWVACWIYSLLAPTQPKCRQSQRLFNP